MSTSLTSLPCPALLTSQNGCITQGPVCVCVGVGVGVCEEKEMSSDQDDLVILSFNPTLLQTRRNDKQQQQQQ